MPGLTQQSVPSSASSGLKEVKEWLSRSEAALAARKFYEGYPLNEFWQKHNTPKMVDILNRASTERDALERIQNTDFFVVNLANDTARRALQWQWDRLARSEPEILEVVEAIGESALVPEALTIPYNGRRYSVDIVRIATVASRIVRIANGCATPVFFELGAGLGHLARFIKRLNPSAKYIIADLPISLCFSYLFLKHSQPEARVRLLDVGTAITREIIENHDVLLVPPSVLQESAPDAPVDVFINTCSLGEMDNSVSARWLSYVDRTLRPTHIYSLNRFLNHIDDSPDYQWRAKENAHLAGIGASWVVDTFNLEDDRLFSPYLDCVHPRYLELVLRRTPSAEIADADLNALADDLLAHASIALYQRYGWAVNYYGRKLSNDLSVDGQLFGLWNAARVKPCPLSYLLLLVYLDRLNIHSRMPFEESLFLESRLSSWSKQLSQPVQAAVSEFLKRRAAAAGLANAMQRNDSNDLAALCSILRAEHQRKSAPLMATG